MNRFYIHIVLCLSILGNMIHAQNREADSLWSVYNQEVNDSTKINTLFKISNAYYRTDPVKDIEVNKNIVQLSHKLIKNSATGEAKKHHARNQGAAYINIALNYEYFHLNDYDTALYFFHKALEIGKQYNIPDITAASLGNIGTVLEELGRPKEALSYFEEVLELSIELGNEVYIATAYDNLGNINKHIGDYPKALENHMKALKIFEKIEEKNGVANVLNNISLIYSAQGENELAMDYLRKCLVLDLESRDVRSLAGTYNNIGSLFHNNGVLDSARFYYYKSLSVAKETENNVLLATAYQNLGSLAMDQDYLDSAYTYVLKALSIRESIDDQVGIAKSLSKLGLLYVKRGEEEEAFQTLLRAYTQATSVGLPVQIKESAYQLYEIYEKRNDFSRALQMFETYVEMRDSIKNEENSKAIIRQEYEYQYEKKAAADSTKTAESAKIKDAQLEAEKFENNRQRVIIYFSIALVIIILFFVRMVFKNLKTVSAEKLKVDEAYEQLEEKNNEILDSINYAKRIQSAILPPRKVVKEYLPISFILYKPKDIVAGDFYWLEHADNKVLFAACDCTGHGVPGAMVSVVCNNGLNRSVREYGLTDPGEILDKTREVVISEFEKSEEEVKDGMDVALCSLEGNTLHYAGANNPLWIIRKGSLEVEEIKADKQPIGKYGTTLPYTTHSIELNPGDSVYIFSDGYADQFGGERGKKFKASNFKDLLISIQEEDMEKQRDLITETFESWKGDLEQLDDVCVIGVRV